MTEFTSLRDADDGEHFERIRKSRSRTKASGVNSGKEKRAQNTAKMGYKRHGKAQGH